MQALRCPPCPILTLHTACSSHKEATHSSNVSLLDLPACGDSAVFFCYNVTIDEVNASAQMIQGGCTEGNADDATPSCYAVRTLAYAGGSCQRHRCVQPQSSIPLKCQYVSYSSKYCSRPTSPPSTYSRVSPNLSYVAVFTVCVAVDRARCMW